MIKKLLPVLLILIGGGAGIAAGLVLQPAPEPEIMEAADGEEAMSEDHMNEPVVPEPVEKVVDTSSDDPEHPGESLFEYAEMSNQFVVPIVRSDVVTALVVMTLSLEVQPGSTDLVYSIEPRLRDAFLQAMFDHAAAGGFSGAFANNHNLSILKRLLRQKAYGVLGPLVNDILISDIARQDI